MKTKQLITAVALLTCLSALNPQLSTVFAQGTAFTYQGRLTDGANPAQGIYDLRSTIYDALSSGSVVAGPITNSVTGVTNGLFTITLDFGSVFTGNARWLEIGVRTNGSGAFTTLSPRQALAPTPYAIYAEDAADLSGTLSASQLTSIGNTNGGSGNFFVGSSGNSTTSGYCNTANGYQALYSNTSGYDNTANGVLALCANTSGYYNTANGFAALYSNTSGYCNTANGAGALQSNTTGGFNTANGYQALYNSTSGNNNIALGFQAGCNLTTGSFNIDIGNPGVSTDTNIIRIGSGQSSAFIAGVIYGNGGGLTNLNAASLTGSLTGNGAGLTNLNPANLSGGTAGIRISGNAAGFTGSLAGDVTGTQGATVVSTVGGQSAANVASGVTAANAATINNTGNTIVKRAANGDFAAGTIYAYQLGWGNGNDFLGVDQTGAIELGNSMSNHTAPYIDFHYGVGMNQDYNVRLMNEGDQLLVCHGNFQTTGRATAAGGLFIGTGTPNPIEALEVHNLVLIKGNDAGGAEYSDWPNPSLSIRRSDDFVANGVTMLSLGYRNDPLYATDDSVANIRLWDPSQSPNAATSTSTTQLRIASPGPLVLQPNGGSVGIGTGNPQAALDVNGTFACSVLTINGGSDLAEPFHISSREIPKGSVVVIDENNPGHLKLSGQAYDRKVAGVISGANGIQPGITLRQEGLMEGEQNVALSGRVYVLAEAAGGPIEPGDLLTTSSTPGHAMKVTDYARAQGAIMGKAMGALREGRGMVLVLVSLQ